MCYLMLKTTTTRSDSTANVFNDKIWENMQHSEIMITFLTRFHLFYRVYYLLEKKCIPVSSSLSTRSQNFVCCMPRHQSRLQMRALLGYDETKQSCSPPPETSPSHHPPCEPSEVPFLCESGNGKQLGWNRINAAEMELVGPIRQMEQWGRDRRKGRERLDMEGRQIFPWPLLAPPCSSISNPSKSSGQTTVN